MSKELRKARNIKIKALADVIFYGGWGISAKCSRKIAIEIVDFLEEGDGK